MKLVIGVVVISLFVLSAVGYVGSLKTKYGMTANMTGFNNTETRLNEISDLANRTQDSMYQDTVLPGVVDVTWGVVKVGINSAKMLWKGMGLFVAISKDSYNIISDEGLIPKDATNWLWLGILTIIFAAIIIWAVSLFLRWYA